MHQLSPPKPFRSYSELVALLVSRGMQIEDEARAARKLAQVGYYRLSGFWFPCKAFRRDTSGQVVLSPVTHKPERSDDFVPMTRFDAVFELYLFDKKLRQLMLDAIERIEVNVRSVIAHEVGYHHPLAYKDPVFINPSQTRDFVDARTGRRRNIWDEWLIRQNDQVKRSREDCIEWHRQCHKAMPFWVVVEAWDFGTVSKYFEMLKRGHQNRICERMGISNPAVLKEWLQDINTLRNRCAHHTRIWNQYSNNPLPVLPNAYFQELNLDINARTRLYGLIAVIWFLVKSIGPNSNWINEVANVINSKPDLVNCTYAAMGMPPKNGLPRTLFDIDTRARGES
jgi:abortive infection bacteriophage resistance protein